MRTQDTHSFSLDKQALENNTIPQPLDQLVPFNKSHVTGKELSYIQQAIDNAHLSGNGSFTQKCQEALQNLTNTQAVFLTHSGTGALEMAALLIDISPGDEVIVPSFTFVTTASAFVLRGAIPVFVDIRPDTLNLDETAVEAAITKKTKAIVPVHYAGLSCEMDRIVELATPQNIYVIEDAAHALLSTYKNRPVGSLGHLAALSFHETKNITAGEGGALLINQEELMEKAHLIWEKGTNRREFGLGATDKYTWQMLGSSFPPSEITAAFLWAQITEIHTITNQRIRAWQRYHSRLKELEDKGKLMRPVEAAYAQRNGHIYYILVQSEQIRNRLLAYLNTNNIGAVFHYIPLHSSPAGSHYGRCHGSLKTTDDISTRLIRLPLWADLPDETIDTIVGEIETFFKSN